MTLLPVSGSYLRAGAFMRTDLLGGDTSVLAVGWTSLDDGVELGRVELGGVELGRVELGGVELGRVDPGCVELGGAPVLAGVGRVVAASGWRSCLVRSPGGAGRTSSAGAGGRSSSPGG